MANRPFEFTPGVLARDQLTKLVEEGYVSTNHGSPPEVGAAAIDLSLGTKARKLKVAERPTTRELSKIQRQSEEIPLVSGKFEFEAGSIYLVELADTLKLPSNVSGRASGKSSVGRLDVITRLITDRGLEYDVVPAGYEGALHVLLMPQTFSIRVAPGKSVNQLRLFSGAHADAVIRRDEAPHYGTPFWWEFKPDYQTWPIRESGGSRVLGTARVTPRATRARDGRLEATRRAARRSRTMRACETPSCTSRSWAWRRRGASRELIST